MPAMRIFGRRTALATDDFTLIGFIDSLLFLPWLAWAPVVYASFLQHRPTCEDPETLLLQDIWLPALCSLLLANWLLAALFVIVSSRGTISQPEPRRHVVSLVYVKLVISLLDAGCVSLSTYIYFTGRFCDALGVPALLEASTIFLWLATVVRLTMAVLLVDWDFSRKAGHAKQGEPKEFFDLPVRKNSCKKWHLRLQALLLWCTTPSDARQQAFKTASELLAIISYDINLTASDMLAGLLLQRQKCFRRHKAEQSALAESPPITTSDEEVLERFPPEDWPQWMNLKDARHFMEMSMGVFGWAWYIYTHLACGCCRLLTKLWCCFCCRAASAVVLGDNCCGCKTAGLQATTGLPFSDIVLVDFRDRVFELPFYVALDRAHHSVIIAVRGTMSVDDMLTDVVADFIEVGGPDGDALAHRGMLEAARSIKGKLDEAGVLERVLQHEPALQLVVTGHSLGASVGSLLTLLLRHEHPGARCYAFAPPPSVDARLLAAARDRVFVLLYGHDNVAALKFEAVNDVVAQMVHCVQRCRQPKYKVFLNSERILDEEEGEEDIEKDIFSNGNGKTPENYGTLTGSHSSLNSSEPVRQLPNKTYVAGRILHIRRSRGGFRLRLAEPDDYNEVVFRPRMVLHHFPQILLGALQELGRQDVVLADHLAAHTPHRDA